MDNTLYDWVRFFARSYALLLSETERVLGLDEGQLSAEFRDAIRDQDSLDRPAVLFHLRSVKASLRTVNPEQRDHALTAVLESFEATYKAQLQLYESVRPTLEVLRARSIKLVAYTDGVADNAIRRLKMLDIDGCFERVYARIESQSLASGCTPAYSPPVVPLPPDSRKPSPSTVLGICRSEGIPPNATCYVGDDIERDILAANLAGVVAVWARYGTRHSDSDLKCLARLVPLRDSAPTAQSLGRPGWLARPDHVIDSFSQLISIAENLKPRP